MFIERNTAKKSVWIHRRSLNPAFIFICRPTYFFEEKENNKMHVFVRGSFRRQTLNLHIKFKAFFSALSSLSIAYTQPGETHKFWHTRTELFLSTRYMKGFKCRVCTLNTIMFWSVYINRSLTSCVRQRKTIGTNAAENWTAEIQFVTGRSELIEHLVHPITISQRLVMQTRLYCLLLLLLPRDHTDDIVKYR